MKKVIMGTFSSHSNAEALLKQIREQNSISADNISYIYRNADGEIARSDDTISVPLEGASTGAVVGGTAGALAGIATVMGIIPVIGPIFAAGPIITALGIGAGAVATAAAGALTGAVAGTIIGFLVGIGVPETDAQAYEKRVSEGDVLVIVHSDNEAEVLTAFKAHDASTISVHTYGA